MQTVTDIVNRWPTVADFAAAVGVPYQTAYSWRSRNSIPFRHAQAVVSAARKRHVRGVTVGVLATLAVR